MKFDKIPIPCDNTNAFNLTKNPIQHFGTRHIEIKHHFIRDHVHRGESELNFINSKKQITNIFKKPFHEDQFVYYK